MFSRSSFLGLHKATIWRSKNLNLEYLIDILKPTTLVSRSRNLDLDPGSMKWQPTTMFLIPDLLGENYGFLIPDLCPPPHRPKSLFPDLRVLILDLLGFSPKPMRFDPGFNGFDSGSLYLVPRTLSFDSDLWFKSHYHNSDSGSSVCEKCRNFN